MVARLALAPCTARLTRAIGRFSLLQLSSWRWLWSCSPFGCPRLATEQAAHRAPVALGHDAGAAEPPLLAGGLLGEQVVQLGVAAQQLAVLGHGEAAGGTAVALHLGHGRGLPALAVCSRTFRLVISARSPVPCGGELAPPHGPPKSACAMGTALGCPARCVVRCARAARQGVRAGAEGAPPLGCAAFLRGEKTAIMLRPSCRAGLSTWAMSTMSVASRSSRRRPRQGRDLDQIEIGATCDPQSGLRVHDPELLAVRTDHPELRRPDTVVDSRLNADATSLLYRPTDPGPSARSTVPADRRPEYKKAARGPPHPAIGWRSSRPPWLETALEVRSPRSYFFAICT